jgi:hypothetical protein
MRRFWAPDAVARLEFYLTQPMASDYMALVNKNLTLLLTNTLLLGSAAVGF